jgi:hypothetical protein
MASNFRPYYPRVQNRPQTAETNDVQRGMMIGSAFGKDIQGLGTALAQGIQEARKNALANQLMDEASIGDQPGAGQTMSLGKLGGDGGAGQTQDLGTVPADSTFTNPATGNVEPLQQDQGVSDDDFSRAIAAARLQSSPSAATVGNAPATSANGRLGGDFTLNPSDYSAGGTAFGDTGSSAGTVGGLIHTGGVQEMELRKEMLAQRLQQEAARAKAADEQAKASGTGQYALEAAQKRATLAHTQAETEALKNKPAKEEKNPPAVNIGSEPVTDQGQLNRHIDGIYGNGTANDIAATLNEPDTIADPTDPTKTIANPNAPVVTGNSVAVGPEKHRVTMSLAEAQIYTKQANALRLKQGLPAYRVPGEDQSVGATAANPYPAKTNLDVYSRAPGTWVRLPNGKIAQVPGKQ